MNEEGDKRHAKRVRSPNYPSMSLAEAVQQIQKLFAKVGRHPVPRDSIATAMGYGGLHGASATAISALAKYGLLERVGEDYKLSERAMKIIAPHDAAEKTNALEEAGEEPALFAELIDHFKGEAPGEEVLRPYLIRRGFAQAAVSSAINAYRDTIELVTREGGRYARPEADSGAGQSKTESDGSDEPGARQKTPPAGGAVRPMEGERVVFTHEIEPSHAVRVVASGEVDGGTLAVLESYVQHQRNRFAKVNLEKLLNAGFSEIPSRGLWYSRERRMAFSHQAIREMDPWWMDRHIGEEVGAGDFVFHFVKPPQNIQVCKEILTEMELSSLRPNVRLASFVHDE